MKASEKQIAKRYVSALLASTSDPKLLAQIGADLDVLAKAYEDSADFRLLLASPLLGRAEQAAAMQAILTKGKAQALTQQFIVMLATQKRLAILPAIIREYRVATAALRGEMTAEVVSASALGKKELDAIAGQLGASFGKSITLSTRQDPELLGGAIVNIGSLRLDGSLAGKLRRLGQKLKAA